jgi:hypothetical protein
VNTTILRRIVAHRESSLILIRIRLTGMDDADLVVGKGQMSVAAGQGVLDGTRGRAGSSPSGLTAEKMKEFV